MTHNMQILMDDVLFFGPKSLNGPGIYRHVHVCACRAFSATLKIMACSMPIPFTQVICQHYDISKYIGISI